MVGLRKLVGGSRHPERPARREGRRPRWGGALREDRRVEGVPRETMREEAVDYVWRGD